MNTNRRSQAAIEYLVTYGWVFVVILAAIAVLTYFDVLSVSNYLPEQCEFGQQMSCVDHYLDTDGTMLLRFKNLYGANITIVNATVYDLETEDFEQIFVGVVGGTLGSSSPVTIPVNEIARVEFDLGREYLEGRKERVVMQLTFRRQAGVQEHQVAGTVFSEVSEPLI